MTERPQPSGPSAPSAGVAVGPMLTAGWDVLIPVKRFDAGKTRLAELGSAVRVRVARAIALDTVTAACAAKQVGRVVLVTDEPALRAQARRHNLTVVPDHGGGDLNRAITAALTELFPATGTIGTAVLLADLAGLLPADLDTALRAAAEHQRSFVRDHRGTGTTLLTARRGTSVEPRFGPSSAARHGSTGAVAVTEPVLTLRRDVDVLEDLRFSDAVPPGRHTGALLARHCGGVRLRPEAAWT
jgi:2-phospho-L-lactate guanylyltransferase